MQSSALRFYQLLAGIAWPPSWRGRWALIAFWGVHLPLLVLVCYLALVALHWSTAFAVLAVGVIAALVGALLVVLLQAQALAAIGQITDALNGYLTTGELSSLPTAYPGAAGALLAKTQATLTQLDRLLQLKPQLLTILSHDLRNPVTSMLLATDLMGKELTRPISDPARLQRHLLTVRVAAQQQLALAANTLALLQSTTAPAVLEWSDVNLQRLGNELSTELQLQAAHRKLAYTVKVACPPEQLVAIDEAKTKQLLTNLVTHTMRFAPADAAITLEIDYQNSGAFFCLRQRGLTMDKTTHAVLFQPLAALQAAGNASATGAGLGLSISKTFVELQQGQLRVEHEPGVESCVTIYLPDQKRLATPTPVVQAERTTVPPRVNWWQRLASA